MNDLIFSGKAVLVDALIWPEITSLKIAILDCQTVVDEKISPSKPSSEAEHG